MPLQSVRCLLIKEKILHDTNSTSLSIKWTTSSKWWNWYSSNIELYFFKQALRKNSLNWSNTWFTQPWTSSLQYPCLPRELSQLTADYLKEAGFQLTESQSHWSFQLLWLKQTPRARAQDHAKMTVRNLSMDSQPDKLPLVLSLGTWAPKGAWLHPPLRYLCTLIKTPSSFLQGKHSQLYQSLLMEEMLQSLKHLPGSSV